MENTQDRLAHFVQHTGLNYHQFSLKTGLSNGLLGNITKKKASFTNDTIEKILSAFPELNIEWILNGQGEMLKRSIYGSSLSLHEPVESYISHKNENIIYIFPESLGDVFPALDKSKLTSFYLPWLEPGIFWAFKMTGDSMQHTFSNGDFIIAKELDTLDWLRNGEVHVFLTNKGTFIKRAHKMTNGNIRLSSDQEGYDDEEMEPSSIRAVFLVIEKCSQDLGIQHQKTLLLYKELLRSYGVEMAKKK